MPVGVVPCAQHVERQGDEREQAVEEVEPAGVEAGAAQPPGAPAAARGGAVDHPDEGAPELRRGAEDAEEDGTADGLHAGGGLAVEELEQADEGGDVHHAQQEELRRQPEHRHRRGGRGRCSGGGPPPRRPRRAPRRWTRTRRPRAAGA